LININSAEGDHECTMDEVETINDYLRMQAGEATDVIVGMGYDPTLDKKIGITIIATGFEHKDPFSKPAPVKKVEVQEEKIVMVLGESEKPAAPVQLQQPVAEVVKDPFEPHMQEPVVEEMTITVEHSHAIFYDEEKIVAETEVEKEAFHFELSLDLPDATATPIVEKEAEPEIVTPVAKTEMEELVQFTVTEQPSQPVVNRFGGLHKPNNIYAVAEEETTEHFEAPKAEEIKPIPEPAPQLIEKEEEMQLVMREAFEPIAPKQPIPVQAAIPQDDSYMDESEEQKRRAADRIQKLRNLSFNMNTTDPNNEFDSVPAYIRRNMELFGSTLTNVENFYSKVTVGKDSNNHTQLSTINTFLDGKKPD
jgi:cell division protein FtsZ